MAVLADRDLYISRDDKAIEGLAGAAVLYTIFAVVLTCCLGGVTFFAFLGLVLDVCFIGAMIAIAILTRHGANSCSGFVRTPLGNGQAGTNAVGANNFGFGSGENLTYSPNLGLACRLNTAAFAVSIVGAVLFLITALMQIALSRRHKKESRYGPSPANNYTSGYGGSKRKFWQRKPKNATEKEAELGGAGLAASSGAAPADLRPSHDTAYTGSTVAAPNGTYAKKELEQGPHAPHAAGYDPHGTSNGLVHDAPVATSGRGTYMDYGHGGASGVANPYGYVNEPATGTGRNF